MGNTRVVLTDEQQQDVYPAATLEPPSASFLVEQAYYAINNADTISVQRIPSWNSTTGNAYASNNGNPPYNNNPYAVGDVTNQFVYHLNGATGHKTGLGITLRVMPGDVVNIYGKSFWHSNTASPSNGYSITTALNSFIDAFANTSAIAAINIHNAASVLENTASPTPGAVTSWLNSVPTPSVKPSLLKPKAYINWILFDDQFNVVTTGSGFDGVNATADAVKTHNITVTIAHGGFLYVYCSNENNLDVYFDNLQVIQTRGPLLETDNYYPFGLAMTGINSQAAGKLENLHKYNKGSELQHKEFSDGSGLELYDTHFRQLDPQTGRWNQIDPDIEDDQESTSPYQAMADDPIRYNDPKGDCPWCEAIAEEIEEAGPEIVDWGTEQGHAIALGATGMATGIGSWLSTQGENIKAGLDNLAKSGAFNESQYPATFDLYIKHNIQVANDNIAAPTQPVTPTQSVPGVTATNLNLSAYLSAYHGNSNKSALPQHGYVIKEKKTVEVNKYGISGQKLNKDGTSPRANPQVNKLNKQAGYDKYKADVPKKNVAGRAKIKNWEVGKVKGFKKASPGGNSQPKGNILPKV